MKAEESRAREYLLEEMGDLAIVQIYADAFAGLAPREKILAYCLTQAALAGRDIAFDQGHRHGLAARRLVEDILLHAEGVHPKALAAIAAYARQLWVHNGFYHCRSSRKFVLRLPFGELLAAARAARAAGASFGVEHDADLARHLEELRPHLLEPEVEPIQTAKNPGPGQDVLAASAVNLYAGVAADDLAGFRARYPLNSRLVKGARGLVEEVYRAGGGRVTPGRYAAELGAVIGWLERAVRHASESQAEVLRRLIRFFRTGESEDFRAYNIAWVADRSPVDTINGFIEVYKDPLAAKGEFQGGVFFEDPRRTALLRRLAGEAAHLEARAPWADAYKRTSFGEPVAASTSLLMGVGGCGPVCYAGVNLPNAQELRQEYGSKSFLYWNVVEAHRAVTAEKLLREFAADEDEIALGRRWAEAASFAHISLHEVVGHGSGKVRAGLAGDPADHLREYYSTLEEARADLMGLWSIWDGRMAEIGLVPDPDVARQAGVAFVRRSLLQLRGVRHGNELEEDHERGCQLAVSWLRERTEAIQVVERDGKVYLRVADHEALRRGVGGLLAEIMRIKAEGDYAAARELVTRYGIRIDPRWRDQVVARAEAVGLPSVFACVMPDLAPVFGKRGEMVDVAITHPRDFRAQMVRYAGGGGAGGGAAPAA